MDNIWQLIFKILDFGPMDEPIDSEALNDPYSKIT